MEFYMIFGILFTGGLMSDGYSLTDNMTNIFLKKTIEKDSDVFRQLLNQETIIRISLVTNVHSLMKDMVTLKQELVKQSRDMDNLKLSMETLTNQEINRLKTEVEQLKRENQKLNNKVTSQFNIVNDTFETVAMDITNIKRDFKEFEINFEEKRINYEKNTSGIMSDIKVEVGYLSVTLLNLNQHTVDLKKNIPNLLDEKQQMVMGWVNDTYRKVDSELQEYSERQQRYKLALSDLEFRQNITSSLQGDVNGTINVLQENVQKCQSDNSKLSLTVSALELFHLKKGVGFTAAITTYSSSWAGDTLIFPKVLFSIGGGYDINTGKFTSPVDGHFVFYISIQSYYSQSIYLDIVLNGAPQVRAMNERQSVNIRLTGTNMVLLHLNKGDRVWVKWHAGSGYYSTSSPTVTFSGFYVF